MAKGVVTWVNPPENKGKIKRTDDSSNNIYEYNINAGDTVSGYVPKLDEQVIFEPGPGMTATGVKKDTGGTTNPDDPTGGTDNPG